MVGGVVACSRAENSRRSSVVERTLGKGEVECSIHSGSTTVFHGSSHPVCTDPINR